VRAQLDETLVPAVDECDHGVGEADWLTQVGRPVSGVERGAVLESAGDSGQEGDGRRLRPEVSERGDQVVA
jgi:hypothetical protein